MQESLNPSQPNISREFLDIFNQLVKNEDPERVFDLPKEPTKNELRYFISDLPIEIGLDRLNNNCWKLIEGESSGVVAVSSDIADHSDIVAHSHLPLKYDNGTLPSFEDADTNKGEFIIHVNGLTYFTPIIRNPMTGKAWKRYDSGTIQELNWFSAGEYWRILMHPENNKTIEQAHEELLGKMGVKIVRKTWQELPDKNPLSNFAMRVLSA